MARIPDVEIERLKEEVSLVRLVETSGVKLEKRGKDWVGCCPFHKDDTPSLSVTPDKNLWRCFGCDAGGDVIAWVMKREGVSFRHAVELLREGYAPDAVPTATRAAAPVKASTVPKLATMTAPAEDAALLDEVVGYYTTTLKQTPDALAYLEGRGLAHPELIQTFRLGYADRTLGYRLPQANRKAGAEVRGRLQALGVLRDSGHEHLRGSLVVPILDADGRVTNLYGRKIGESLRKGTPDHLYLPGPHRGVFNRAALEASDEIILTEALIDALTFWSAGWRHVTSSYGAGGFTAELLEALEAHGVKRVLIAYDRDAAGDRGAASVAEQVAARGMTAFRVQFPKGMDANQYAQAVTPATRSLGALLRSAEWIAGAGRPARRSPEAHPAPPEPDPDGDLPSAAEMETAPVVEEMAEPTTASPVPPGPSAEATVAAEVGDRDVVIRLGDRTWRARGLARNPSVESLKVNLMVRRPSEGGELFHVDGLELLSAKARGAFVAEASAELGLAPEAIKRDLGLVLLKLEAVQEERLEAARTAEAKTGPAMTATQENAALAWLQAPDLMGRIAADVASCGVVGEAENALCVYLAALSRKLDRPLAVLIQSTSAAGKSALMDAVMDLIPQEERVAYSAMTGQSLFYLGEADLKHKALAIAEEEGARHAGYALKLLQSQGTLTIASTGKDPATGKLVTQDYTVEGPVALMMTTTAIDLDEELRNRCLVLTIDESREQTRAIHARQRFEETLEGLRGRQDQAAIRTLHQNAQRLIRPLKVVNPFAERLTFLDDQTRTRRDHRKYLGLIRVIALLHQHQRPIRTLARPADGQEGEPVAYIEATVADIAVANRLAHAVLGTTLDELPPQTRRLLALIRTWTEDRATAEAVKPRDLCFTRREVREATGWGDTQLKVHLHRLEELEYLLTRRDGTRLVYELAWGGEGRDGSPFVMGLIDTADLAESGLAQPDQTTNEWCYDGERAGLEDDRAGSGRLPVGGWSGDSRAAEHAPEPRLDGPSSPIAPITPGKPRLGRNGAAVVGAAASYAQA